MTDSQPDPGRWQCDVCGDYVHATDAHTELVPGGEEPTILAFCEGCTEDRR